MVLRRYTPPTCTLEIKAKESPLSRWAGRPVLKHLKFELRFDDPRQPEEKRCTIWGDRAELEDLCEAVTTYVQNFLNQSRADKKPQGCWLSVVPSPESSLEREKDQHPTLNSKRDNSHSEDSPALLASSINPFQPLAVATERKSEELEQRDAPESEAPSFGKDRPTPYLQPRGLLTHDLFLGSLETEESGPVVSLSVLQLFDLATALDEYAADIVALPQLKRPVWRQAPPPWTKAAAMVLVTMGLTTAAIKLLDRSSTNPKTATLPPPSPASSPAASPSVVAQATPVPTPPVPTPPLSTSPVPTPPAPIPLGNNPLTLPPPTPVVVPAAPNPMEPPPLVIPGKPPASSGSSSSPIVIQPETSTAPPRSSSSPPLVPLPSAKQPSSRKARIQQEPNLRPQPQAVAPPEQSADPPRTASTPSIAALPSFSPIGRSPKRKVKPGDTPLPELSPSPPIPPVQEESRETAPTIATGRAAPSSVESSQGKITQQRRDATSDSVAGGRLFDSIPQVAEVRNYFQQHWKPPSDLTQPLQYELFLKADGSIDRIIPLGSAAGTYIDRTGMPMPGERLVSPIDRRSTATIRVVLYPDGKVETLLSEPMK